MSCRLNDTINSDFSETSENYMLPSEGMHLAERLRNNRVTIDFELVEILRRCAHFTMDPIGLDAAFCDLPIHTVKEGLEVEPSGSSIRFSFERIASLADDEGADWPYFTAVLNAFMSSKCTARIAKNPLILGTVLSLSNRQSVIMALARNILEVLNHNENATTLFRMRLPYKGMPVCHLEQAYEKYFGFSLDPYMVGFCDVLDLLCFICPAWLEMFVYNHELCIRESLSAKLTRMAILFYFLSKIDDNVQGRYRLAYAHPSTFLKITVDQMRNSIDGVAHLQNETIMQHVYSLCNVGLLACQEEISKEAKITPGPVLYFYKWLLSLFENTSSAKQVFTYTEHNAIFTPLTLQYVKEQYDSLISSQSHFSNKSKDSATFNRMLKQLQTCDLISLNAPAEEPMISNMHLNFQISLTTLFRNMPNTKFNVHRAHNDLSQMPDIYQSYHKTIERTDYQNVQPKMLANLTNFIASSDLCNRQNAIFPYDIITSRMNDLLASSENAHSNNCNLRRFRDIPVDFNFNPFLNVLPSAFSDTLRSDQSLSDTLSNNLSTGWTKQLSNENKITPLCVDYLNPNVRKSADGMLGAQIDKLLIDPCTPPPGFLCNIGIENRDPKEFDTKSLRANWETFKNNKTNAQEEKHCNSNVSFVTIPNQYSTMQSAEDYVVDSSNRIQLQKFYDYQCIPNSAQMSMDNPEKHVSANTYCSNQLNEIASDQQYEMGSSNNPQEMFPFHEILRSLRDNSFGNTHVSPLLFSNYPFESISDNRHQESMQKLAAWAMSVNMTTEENTNI